MGAWGSGVYDNDEAVEFAADVVHGGGLERIDEALERVIATGDDYLEAPEASEAVAAADVVTRLRGRNIPEGTGVAELDLWLEEVDFFAGEAQVEKARAAMARVLRKPSELMELWSETGELDAGWARGVELIVRRLG